MSTPVTVASTKASSVTRKVTRSAAQSKAQSVTSASAIFRGEGTTYGGRSSAFTVPCHAASRTIATSSG
jgi:hypothetical protein